MRGKCEILREIPEFKKNDVPKRGHHHELLKSKSAYIDIFQLE
jgi:hypothetical protein